MDDFWWNWPIQLLIAIGTIGAVVVALFGQWIKAYFLPPRLHLAMPKPLGELCPAKLTRPDGTFYDTDSRWYHVEVENSRRRIAPATGVQVFLQRIDEYDPGIGQYGTAWIGSEVTIRLKSQQLKPITRTIGRPDGCDLFSIIKEGPSQPVDTPVLSI